MSAHAAPKLGSYNIAANQHSISGLSSGAFMTVQLHLAYSASFIGAGVVAGGPYRCAESSRQLALTAEDSYMVNALYICMTPLTPRTGPNPVRLAQIARQTEAAGQIDPLSNLARQRLYIFTGTEDSVVSSTVVETTSRFYQELGVPSDQILFINNVPAGHSLITDNIEDSYLAANQPPYLNYGGYYQSHDILRHIYGRLAPPVERLSGRIMPFEQAPFLDPGEAEYACLSRYGYVYVPDAVARGEKARGVHIAIHGCKQGAGFVSLTYGLPDMANQPPYGNRYVTTTGYNEIADSNNFIVLYPQCQGDDDSTAQNPDGCWDWWGYTSKSASNPDYYTRDAVQIKAIHRMLETLCRGAES